MTRQLFLESSKCPRCWHLNARYRICWDDKAPCNEFRWHVSCPDCGHLDCDPVSARFNDNVLLAVDEDPWEYAKFVNCPSCSFERAVRRTWESVEFGVVNGHWNLRCSACGFYQSDPFLEDEERIKREREGTND